MRRAVSIIVAAAVAAGLSAAPAAAQNNAGQAAADAAQIARCLDRATTDGARQACIGLIERACADQMGAETATGMVACANRELAAWDARLNARYRTLMSAAGGESPTQQAALRAAQRAWIPWRDARCAYAASLYEGGSLGGVLHASCLAETTAARVIDLEERSAERY